jgi:hypothetical protein
MTAPAADSHTGDPEKPPTTGWSPGTVCSCTQPVPCPARNRPLDHTPSQAPSGKPSARNDRFHTSSARRSGGIRAPMGSGSRTRSSATSPVPSGPIGSHRDTVPVTRGAAPRPPSNGRSNATTPRGGEAAYASAPSASATTCAHVATVSGPATNPAPTTSPARDHTRTAEPATASDSPRSMRGTLGQRRHGGEVSVSSGSRASSSSA